MAMFRILLCHVLLFGIVLSSPVENKAAEKKPLSEAATQIPLKVDLVKNTNNEEIQKANNAQTEKSATKKRNAPEVLTDKNEYFDDDFYEGRATDDYDGNQALRVFLENSRNDNAVLDSRKFRVGDYRYYDEEARRKRTTTVDNYREPEINLSPEDLMILAAYRQPHHLRNTLPYGRWTDLNFFDIPDAEVETAGALDRPENFFDGYYNQRYQNWANLPRNNKFILNRQRRSYLGYPKLRVPIYKRTVL